MYDDCFDFSAHVQHYYLMLFRLWSCNEISSSAAGRYGQGRDQMRARGRGRGEGIKRSGRRRKTMKEERKGDVTGEGEKRMGVESVTEMKGGGCI